MGEQVSVESFEALSGLRAALCEFMDSASAVLYAADADLQRTKTWVKSEQVNHWKAELRKRNELLIQAKLALKYKKLQPSPIGARRSCVDEEEAVAIATRRLAEAEQKSVNVKKWTRQIDEEALAYQTWAAGMKQACSIDVPSAITKLDNMLAALEAYASKTATRMQGSVASSTWEAGATGTETGEYESVARPAPASAPEERSPADEPNAGREADGSEQQARERESS